MLMKYVVVVVSLVLIEIPIKGFEHRSPISVLSILETLVQNIGERLLDNYFETVPCASFGQSFGLYNLVKKNNFKSDAVRIPVPMADAGTGIGFLAVLM